jgi:hypothetical protein
LKEGEACGTLDHAQAKTRGWKPTEEIHCAKPDLFPPIVKRRLEKWLVSFGEAYGESLQKLGPVLRRLTLPPRLDQLTSTCGRALAKPRQQGDPLRVGRGLEFILSADLDACRIAPIRILLREPCPTRADGAHDGLVELRSRLPVLEEARQVLTAHTKLEPGNPFEPFREHVLASSREHQDKASSGRAAYFGPIQQRSFRSKR